MPTGMTKTAFLTQHAKAYLPERCLDLAELMGLDPSEIRVRKMRACWGNCHRTQRVTLNKALIQTPDWVSDYVMIHECAHLVHFDHSKQFWALVGDYCTTVKQAKKWLKEHQQVLL